MGVNLYLEISDGIKNPKKSLTLSRDFYEQVILDLNLIYDQKDCLTKMEQKFIQPNECDFIEIGSIQELKNKGDYFNILKEIISGKLEPGSDYDFLIENGVISNKIKDRERCPQTLLRVIKKIESYLIKNAYILPVCHFLYDSKENISWENEELIYLEIREVTVAVEGDLYNEKENLKIRNKIRLKSYGSDYGKVDFLTEVKPELEIDGKIYFTKTITKAQQFKKDFENIYQILNKAIQHKDNVLWECC